MKSLFAYNISFSLATFTDIFCADIIKNLKFINTLRLTMPIFCNKMVIVDIPNKRNEQLMKKLKYCVFCVARFFVKIFYKSPKFYGTENLPDEPCIIVGNHCHMYGPLTSELYMPSSPYTWCAAQMMELSEVPAYTQYDFWRNKPKNIMWFYKILSYIISPLAVCIFTSARTVPVYHDKRIIKTLRTSINLLKSGKNLVIFPEKDEKYNDILCNFQEGFVDTARSYYKQTGKEISFVPVYLAPSLRQAHFGTPIKFCAENDIKDERKRINAHLMEEITKIAVSLPKHRVVPYNNMPKKNYPYNLT